jgi:RHS repeat-associated protein
VLAVVTDNRTAVDSDGNGAPNYYEAVVAEAREYYPFGMTMPNRKTPAAGNSAYRFGFNGKENDDEAYGDDNQVDFGARVYDGRVSRFLSVDPLAKEYPSTSSYAPFSNNPIFFIDPDGKEIKPFYSLDEKGNLLIKIQVTGKVIDLSGKWFSPAQEFTNEINSSASSFNGLASGIDIEFNGKKYTEAMVNFEFSFEKVNKISEISESDHLFVLAPYRANIKQLATGITNMEGGKVMHIDADFASGPIDDLFDNGLKTGLHELFSHAMGAGHQEDSGTLTFKYDVTGRIGNEKLSNFDRGLIANFIHSKPFNRGLTLTSGMLLTTKHPNTGVTVLATGVLGEHENRREIHKTIGDMGFDIRSEQKNANKKQ